MVFTNKKKKQPTMVKLMKRFQHLLRDHDKAKKIEKNGGERPEQVSIGKAFSVDDLRLMTWEFSADNLLGSFPFANVYKGIFPIQDDDAAAAEMMHVTIKVLLPAHGDVDPALSCAWRLKNELHSRAGPDQVNHLYLPNILGSCWGSGGIFAMVYKLNSHCILEKIAYKDGLSWEDRIHIAFKLALLLEYLHERSPCVSVGNIASCHIILDEARNPILYEFEMRGVNYSAPGHVSSGVENNTCDDINSFGHILISLLCCDEEERALNMYRVSGAIADWETCRLYRSEVGGRMSGRIGYKMTATSFNSHPNYRSYDARRLSKLAFRCVSEKRPCIGDIVGEFRNLFFIGVHAFASLPVNGKTVQELKFSDIENITRGFSVLIGHTQFGVLYRGWFGTKEVTVKVFRDTCTRTIFMAHIPAEIDVKDTIRRLKDEISILRDVRSSILPSLPSLISFCCEEHNVAVVYDFRTVCTLHTLVSNARFDWIRRIEVMNQVARLLQYMHNYDPCFILGNISSHHFLLDEDMQMVLVDFGLLTGGFLGMKKVKKYTKFLGAVGYADPSVLMIGKWYPPIDIHGFGVLLIELVAGRRMTENGFDTPILTSLIQSRRNDEEDHSLDTHSVISEFLKNDQFYYEDDAHVIVKIALSILRHSRKAYGDINKTVHQLEGLMLSRPLEHMYQVMQKKSMYAASNSHTGSSSQ